MLVLVSDNQTGSLALGYEDRRVFLEYCTVDAMMHCKPVTQQREVNYGGTNTVTSMGTEQGEACRSAETYFIGRMALISALSLRRLQTKTKRFPQTMFDIRIPAHLVRGNSRILCILSLWRVPVPVPDPKLLMSEVANNELVSDSHSQIVLFKELEVACTWLPGGVAGNE
jgi:hypothetical protein